MIHETPLRIPSHMDLTKCSDLSGQLRDDRYVDFAGEIFDVISTDYEGIRLNYFGGTIAKHGLMVKNNRIDDLRKRIKKHTSDIIELLLNNHQKLIALYIMHKNEHISDVNSGLGRHPRNTLPILKHKCNEKEHPKLNAFFHADELKLTTESEVNSFFEQCANAADFNLEDLNSIIIDYEQMYESQELLRTNYYQMPNYDLHGYNDADNTWYVATWNNVDAFLSNYVSVTISTTSTAGSYTLDPWHI